MSRPSKKTLTFRTTTANHRRRQRDPIRKAVGIALERANARSIHNRRSGLHALKHVHAAIIDTADHAFDTGLPLRLVRWLIAALLLPLFGITAATFFSYISRSTPENFWQQTEFWYFTTGCILMTGWFFTQLLWNGFLYLYVLGHELTHILFIWLFRGRVADWGVSIDGGYVTTDKSNILIALAPYFVPLWATLAVLLHALAGLVWDLPHAADKVLYLSTGFLWTFHLLWTLWMIPRDQPDLRENGTTLSLVIILLANLLLLSSLVCLPQGSAGFIRFGFEWLTHAAHFSDWIQYQLLPLFSAR